MPLARRDRIISAPSERSEHGKRAPSRTLWGASGRGIPLLRAPSSLARAPRPRARLEGLWEPFSGAVRAAAAPCRGRAHGPPNLLVGLSLPGPRAGAGQRAGPFRPPARVGGRPRAEGLSLRAGPAPAHSSSGRPVVVARVVVVVVVFGGRGGAARAGAQGALAGGHLRTPRQRLLAQAQSGRGGGLRRLGWRPAACCCSVLGRGLALAGRLRPRARERERERERETERQTDRGG
eukprot:scaffold179_cov368-Prasinococcus_capsulatus_cf.AAC.12